MNFALRFVFMTHMPSHRPCSCTKLTTHAIYIFLHTPFLPTTIYNLQALRIPLVTSLARPLGTARRPRPSLPATLSPPSSTVSTRSSTWRRRHGRRARPRSRTTTTTTISTNLGVRIRGQHLRIGIKPRARLRSPRHATCPVRLATGLDPEDGVDVGVVGVGREGLTEAGGGDVAPLAPFLAGAVEGDAALVDDEVGGEAALAEGVAEGGGVAGLVGRGAAGRVWGWVVGGVGVVVGDVAGVAADAGVAAGLLEDGGYFGGGLKGVSSISLGFVRGGHCLLGLRLSAQPSQPPLATSR